MFESIGTQFEVVKQEVIDGELYVWVKVAKGELPTVCVDHESALATGVMKEVGENEFLVRLKAT